MSDVITNITAALAGTGAIVRAVPPDSWQRSSPCADWTVREVTNHLVGGLRIFTSQLTGVPPGAAHDVDWLGLDPVAAYDATALADAAAWARPGALTGTITIGLGTLPAPLAAVVHLTEVLVHGVDIALATGLEPLVDQPACAALLQSMEQMGGVDAYRVPEVFGPAVPAAGHDPAHRRLMAFLGRDLAAGAHRVS